MKNCTIYSHYLAFNKVIEIVKASLPAARVEVTEDGLQKSLIATLKGGLFSKTKTLQINYRQRQNPSYKLDRVECGLTQNLAGMANFVRSLPAKNEGIRTRLLYKVLSLNSEMPFMAEPEITPEFESVLRKIVRDLDGIVFAQPNQVFNRSASQHFTDKELKLILDTNGNCEVTDLEVNVDAKYHDQPAEEYTPEQLQRKARSEAYLKAHDIKVNQNLPCVASSEDAAIRSKAEIVDRAYALLVTAAKGEGIAQDHLDRVMNEKGIRNLSPREREIYQATNLRDEDQAYATWRYERLYLLLWALGKTDELKHPTEICDVQSLVGAMLQPSREEFENTATVRSATEILDELDKIYRMNWTCVDARIKGQPVSGDIHPGIVYERHYALNWLTNYQEQEWDEVQTNT